jgi:mannitol/fructose-specific phosphotransferase system IIA component
MVWYATKLLGTMRFVQENAEAIQVISEDFKEHLDAVNQMEMYFGDETLSELLKHAEHVSNQISTLNEILEDDAEDDEEQEKE